MSPWRAWWHPVTQNNVIKQNHRVLGSIPKKLSEAKSLLTHRAKKEAVSLTPAAPCDHDWPCRNLSASRNSHQTRINTMPGWNIISWLMAKEEIGQTKTRRNNTHIQNKHSNLIRCERQHIQNHYDRHIPFQKKTTHSPPTPPPKKKRPSNHEAQKTIKHHQEPKKPSKTKTSKQQNKKKLHHKAEKEHQKPKQEKKKHEPEKTFKNQEPLKEESHLQRLPNLPSSSSALGSEETSSPPPQDSSEGGAPLRRPLRGWFSVDVGWSIVFKFKFIFFFKNRFYIDGLGGMSF